MSQKEKNDLRNLKKLLARGDINLIATIMKVTRQHVYNVLNGKYANETILLAVKEIAQKRQQEREARYKELTEALSNS